MNITKLKEAEEKFLKQYPGGFSNPRMLEIAKKHKLEKMNKLAQESFTIGQFESPVKIVDSMCKIVSQSSMVSVFEKPKFRDFANALSIDEKERLSIGLKEFLHYDQEAGFKLMCGLLSEYKLAKWPLLTVCPVYFNPGVEVFIKPTTVKGVIAYFELEGLKYSPRPSFEFYRAYRERINEMKAKLGSSFQHDNGAFCGFLMMSIGNTEGQEAADV